MTTPLSSHLSEAERDREVHFRPFSDLANVSDRALERTVNMLGAHIVRLRTKAPRVNRHPLESRLAEIEAELIRRIVDEGRAVGDSPAQEVIRISHRAKGSGWIVS